MVAPASQVLRRIEEEHSKRRSSALPLLLEMRPRLERAAIELRRRFGVTQVWLFGSYARQTPTQRSDVDLAVEGLPAGDHFHAMAYLSDIVELPVDLVRIEELRPIDRRRILREGVQL